MVPTVGRGHVDGREKREARNNATTHPPLDEKATARRMKSYHMVSRFDKITKNEGKGENKREMTQK